MTYACAGPSAIEASSTTRTAAAGFFMVGHVTPVCVRGKSAAQPHTDDSTNAKPTTTWYHGIWYSVQSYMLKSET